MGPITAPMASNRWFGLDHLHCRLQRSELPTGECLKVKSARMVPPYLMAGVLVLSVIGTNAQEAPVVSGANTTEGTAAVRGGWQIEPNITVRETYSDNIALTRKGSERSELVSEINPGVSIKNKASHADVEIDYSLNNFFYLRDRDRNTLNHQLRASGMFELVDDLVFVDSRATIRQQAVSAFGAIGSNSSVNNNNQTVRSYSVSPYLRKKFGNTAIGEARYAFSQQSSNAQNAGISNSTGNRFLLKLDSGPAFVDWGWGAEFLDDRISYEKASDTTFSSLTGNLRYRIAPKLFATGSFGYDKNDYVTTGEKPEGAFWTLGADWRPLHRTALTISAGRRYFGNTYALTFKHAARRVSWDISYQQNLSTSRSQFSQPAGTYRQFAEDTIRARAPGISEAALRNLVDAAAREYAATGRDPDAVQGVNFQTNTAFLEKKWQGLMTLEFPKSQLTFSAFGSVRNSATTGTSILNASGDFALSRVVKQSGVGSHWTYRLSSRNEANFGLDLNRFRLVDIGRTDDSAILNLGLSRKLSPTANGSVGYRFTRRDSNFDSIQYEENAILGTLSVIF